MARINNLENFLQDVADAIKAKKEYQSSQKIAAEDFDTEISSISTLKGEEINITPTTSQQVITPSSGKNAITRATVGAVTSAIDANITANNIKAGVTILGVAGNVEPDKPDQSKTCTPTTSQQVITPDTGYELASVTVNGVTSAIDANIQAGNIKDGVSILGVLGTYEGSGGGVDEDSVIAAHSLLTIANGNNSPYTGIGDTYENDFEILNIALPTEDTYSGAGGTDTQILANLNLILGIAS